MLDRLFFRLFPRLKIPRLIGLPKTMMTPNKLGRVYPAPFFLLVAILASVVLCRNLP
jgi:hypothetical protein